MTAKHTPGPWEAYKQWVRKPNHIALQYQPVAVCTRDARGRADAALIVRAVNTHSALLDAARNALELIESQATHAAHWPDADALRAAIAAATGEGE